MKIHPAEARCPRQVAASSRTPSHGDFLSLVPPALLDRSGSVFYTGKEAFESRSDLYILGLNPGGSPPRQATEKIRLDIEDWRQLSGPWSAYQDESWEGRAAGTHGMQPRVLHLLSQLGIDARRVPASNVVFVRSSTEAALQAEKRELLDLCWPVHEVVIRTLSVRTVLCFGDTAARWVRERTGADEPVDLFIEQNARGWRSEAHLAPDGLCVIKVTHPGRADWRNPAADPTPLIRRMLAR